MYGIRAAANCSGPLPFRLSERQNQRRKQQNKHYRKSLMFPMCWNNLRKAKYTPSFQIIFLILQWKCQLWKWMGTFI